MHFCTFPKREYSIELQLFQLNWNWFAVEETVILKRLISFWYWGLLLDARWGNPKEISHFAGGVEGENHIIAGVQPTGSAVSERTEVSRSSGSEETFCISHPISLCCISVHVCSQFNMWHCWCFGRGMSLTLQCLFGFWLNTQNF